MRVALGLVVLASSALICDHAVAANGRERVAIAAFEVTGEPLSAEAQARLRNSLRGGLAAGFEVVSDTDVDRAIDAAGIRGCDTLACIRRIGEAVFVRRAVTARIQVLGPSNFKTSLELIDLPTDKRYKATDPCAACTLQEVNDGISNAAASLKTQLDAAEAPPQIGSGNGSDKTPAYRRNLPLLAVGGVAGALGVAGIVVGIVEVTRNGDLCGAMVPGGGICERRRDTTTGIAVGFATGVPLLVAGVVLTYYGMRYPVRRAHASLLPSIRSGQLSFTF
jgi:hypothetical protein